MRDILPALAYSAALLSFACPAAAPTVDASVFGAVAAPTPVEAPRPERDTVSTVGPCRPVGLVRLDADGRTYLLHTCEDGSLLLRPHAEPSIDPAP